MSGQEVCESCGSEERLYAHHKIPISEDESLATDTDNGEALCGECHAQEHPEIAEFVNQNPY